MTKTNRALFVLLLLAFFSISHSGAVFGAVNCGGDLHEQDNRIKEPSLNRIGLASERFFSRQNNDKISVSEFIYSANYFQKASLEQTNPSRGIRAGNNSDKTVSKNMLSVLMNNLDNLFPIRSLENKFTNPVPAVYSDVGPATAVQTENQDGHHNILLFANADGIHDYSSIIKVNAGNLQNFYFSMEITVNDVYPRNQGGCFIGYTNESITGKKTEESVVTTAFLMSDSSFMLDVKEKEADGGTHVTLKDQNLLGNSKELTIVRLTGQTFFFVGKELISQYHDGNTGPFQLVYGTTVFADGDTADCSFDNLLVRKVVN